MNVPSSGSTQLKTLSWEFRGRVLELALHHAPCNEIGTEMITDLEQFIVAHEHAVSTDTADALIIYSQQPHGFSAGADLRELYFGALRCTSEERAVRVRGVLLRVHSVLNAIDASPLTTVAAVHGFAFGGGFEVALACDLIVATKGARFCFPELRLGLIPGFGGIPRLKRDVGNGIVRDLLLTGRSISASKAQAVGVVSQIAAEGEALSVARGVASQVCKFDGTTRAAAKHFLKPIPNEELKIEIDLFCELLQRPVVTKCLPWFFKDRTAILSEDASAAKAFPYLP